MHRNLFNIALLIAFIIISARASAQTPDKKFPFAPIGDLSLNTGTDWLDKFYKDKITDSIQIVGLGEVSHGSYEPMAFKAKMIQYLVEKKGYRQILFEKSDFYLRNIAIDLNNNKVQDSTIRKWVERNFMASRAIARSFSETLLWLKKYNLAHPKDMVYIGGYDMGKEAHLVNFVLNNYITPLNYAEGQKYAYQFNNASDTTRLHMISAWFGNNRSLLNKRFGVAETDRLYCRISTAEYEIQRMKLALQYGGGSANQRLYRDSAMALNVAQMMGNKKTILSSHNGHMIRAGINMMGDRLNAIYGPKYYVILTDFSKTAEVEFLRSWDDNAPPPYTDTKTFTAFPSTAAAEIAQNFGITTGMYLHKDILQYRVLDRTNAVDAYGFHNQLPAHARAFDALVVFEATTVDGKPKPKAP